METILPIVWYGDYPSPVDQLKIHSHTHYKKNVSVLELIPSTYAVSKRYPTVFRKGKKKDRYLQYMDTLKPELVTRPTPS